MKKLIVVCLLIWVPLWCIPPKRTIIFKPIKKERLIESIWHHIVETKQDSCVEVMREIISSKGIVYVNDLKASIRFLVSDSVIIGDSITIILESK
jgi:hypothetical protein